ncbi:DUF485 domain-containing protein [Larsenimonas salina]|uniref:DUF485 domain-containing protein n=1 Tax=Larsenimonas salina TaxID=1295565 RepID=UPI003D9A2F3B
MARPTDDASPWQAIQRNPTFQTLVERRGRFATRLSLIMMALYFTFILLIAFAPGVLGMPLGSGTVITLGIPIGLGLIVVAIVC